jgi:beta-galactosidase
VICSSIHSYRRQRPGGRGVNRSGKAIHYYLNCSSAPKTFSYPYGAGTDLLTQAAVAHSQQVTTEPWDLAIIEEK